MGCDMIANVTNLPPVPVIDGYKLKKVFAGDKKKVMDYIMANFSEGWVYECEHAIMEDKCFIATKDGEICGFACYDASAKGYFGPIGVTETLRGTGLGKALLLRTLHAMYEYGYGYAIIGWVGPADFYRKVVNAEYIKGGEPENTVYRNMISM